MQKRKNCFQAVFAFFYIVNVLALFFYLCKYFKIEREFYVIYYKEWIF